MDFSGLKLAIAACCKPWPWIARRCSWKSGVIKASLRRFLAWRFSTGSCPAPCIGSIAAGLEDRFVVHWSPSVAAAEDFPDASADVVWVDGDHSYEGVTADILAWWPKVKPGGWMGGDDFMMFPVAKAVCEQFAPNYILCHGWTTKPEPMPWPSWLCKKG